MSMREMLRGSAPTTGWLQRKLPGDVEVQLTVSGAGAVSAQATFYGSLDGVGLVPLGTLDATGTGVATISGEITRSYEWLRADLTTVSGGLAIISQSGA